MNRGALDKAQAGEDPDWERPGEGKTRTREDLSRRRRSQNFVKTKGDEKVKTFTEIVNTFYDYKLQNQMYKFLKTKPSNFILLWPFSIGSNKRLSNSFINKLHYFFIIKPTMFETI